MHENKFYYVIESKENNVIKQLDIDSSDIIQNADGEIDCPLDRVLRKHHLGMKDLFELNVEKVKFILQTETKETIINCITFQHLTFQA